MKQVQNLALLPDTANNCKVPGPGIYPPTDTIGPISAEDGYEKAIPVNSRPAGDRT